MGSPIAILNIGPTRADDLAHLKINARSGEVCAEALEIDTFVFWYYEHLYLVSLAFLIQDVFWAYYVESGVASAARHGLHECPFLIAQDENMDLFGQNWGQGRVGS